MPAGFDIGASLAASTSATSGLSQDFRGAIGGDFLVGDGASKATGLPNWVIVTALALAAAYFLFKLTKK